MNGWKPCRGSELDFGYASGFGTGDGSAFHACLFGSSDFLLLFDGRRPYRIHLFSGIRKREIEFKIDALSTGGYHINHWRAPIDK